jgi:hypothetical protein
VRFFLWICVVAGVAWSLSLSHDIALQHILVGSRPGRWFYFYLAPFSVYSLLIWALALAVAIGLLYASDILGKRNAWQPVVLWFVGALAIQGLICSLAPFRFEKIFASDGANSFNTVAQRFTPTSMLGDYARVREYWPPHGKSNMPGKPIFVYGLRQITRRIDVLPWLVVAVSNLGGVFLYLLVNDLLGDRRAALYALVLYSIVPGKMFFFPILNTVTPVLVLLSAWLLVRWLKRGRVVYPFLLGISLYLLVIWEPTGLVVGLLFAALVVAAWSRGAVAFRTLAWQTVVLLLGFGALYWAMWWRFHFNLLPIVRMLANDAVEFNVKAARPYDIWVRQNLYDFLFGVGLCAAVLAIGAVVDGIVRGSGVLRRLSEPIVVVVLGLAAVVAVTDLIGINRGEVVRLWIFLACLAQIPAAYVCARLESRWAIILVVAATLLHDALGTDMIGFILPG